MNAHHSEAVVKRCEALIQHLKEFPATFDMATFMKGTEIDKEHPCGTVGCLAGTLVFLEEGPLSGKVTHDQWEPDRQDLTYRSVAIRAEALLEIDKEAARLLWFVDNWPVDLLEDRHYPANEDPDDIDAEASPFNFTAEDGIARIEYFLETGT